MYKTNSRAADGSDKIWIYGVAEKLCILDYQRFLYQIDVLMPDTVKSEKN